MFSEPDISQVANVWSLKTRTQDFVCWMLHLGVTCDQAICPTRAPGPPEKKIGPWIKNRPTGGRGPIFYPGTNFFSEIGRAHV